jgi:arginine N-succinyltransferase
MEFPKADYLSASDKKFIADLMPISPIYIPLLPAAAQDVIGKVHESTKPARKLLENEGFRFNGMVDIFEAGPVLSCRLDEIRIVRESRNETINEISSDAIDSPLFIITNTGQDFRACMGQAAFADTGGVRINMETAEVLQVRQGDRVRLGSLRPTAASGEGA